MNEIENEVLKKVTPSASDRKSLEKVIKELKEILVEEIEKRNLPVKIELVGSTAKDTYLKTNLDIDYFLLFPTKFDKIDISKNTLSIGKKILSDTEESYAEHPYLRGYYKNYFVEIVPSYKIEKASQKLSAVDRTPLHTKYILENLSEKQKPAVLLLKQFLRGIGCYGAEAEIEGFSGYLCEILVLKYGTFNNIIKNAKNWKFGEKLSLTKDIIPKFDTALSFIDPVDRKRNVASALSVEKFNLFIKACDAYLKKPNIKFFFPVKIKPWSIEKIKIELFKHKSQFIGIKFDKPEIINENLYPQMRKAVKAIWKNCIKNDFTIFDVTFHIDDKKNFVYIIIETKEGPLTNIVEHTGPPIKLKKNVDEFKNKWKDDKRLIKGPYEKKGRIFVEIEREFIDIKKFLTSKIKEFSLGKDIGIIINKKYSFVNLNKLLNEDLKIFWTEYLDNKMSWER